MMHERNRRFLCRVLFVTLCVVPTLTVGTWAGYRKSSLYTSRERTEWESAFFQHTGLVASIERIQHPAGGSTVLQGIELLDPDGGQEVLRIRLAEIVRTDQGILISLSQPEIRHATFLRLWETLHERVLRGAPLSQGVQIGAGELTLHLQDSAQTFTRVQCAIDSDDSGIHCSIDFQLAGLSMPSPARLRIDRNRQTAPPSTHWSLESNTPLPCQLFADYLPWVTRFGRQSTFQGEVATTMLRGQWQSTAQGQFKGVDLDLITESLPVKLTGLADLNVDRAYVVSGVVQELKGHMSAQRGIVSPKLLNGLAEHLQASIPQELTRWREPYIAYEQLAFGFDLSPGGIKISGDCVQPGSGVVMNSSTGKLLIIDPRESYSLASIVRTLSPPGQSVVPASYESKWMIDVLALPQQQLPSEAIASPPRARVRLR